MDFTQYTIDELIEIKNKINSYIESFEDGYLYICDVRSYGRRWEDKSIHNMYTLAELLFRYDGQDGIVDVYSTNPDLSEIRNYGSVLFIKSKKDYDMWKDYQLLSQIISESEKHLETWDNRENLDFYQRPHFAPIYSHEDLNQLKKELSELDMSFTPPAPYKAKK